MESTNNYMETDLGNVSPNPKGTYDNATAYEYLDIVEYQGGSYLCIAALGTKITGTAPTPGKNTDAWQTVALPGNVTKEYLDKHADVVEKAKQVETSRAAVELCKQEVESAQADVEQMRQDTQQAAQNASDANTEAQQAVQQAEASRSAAQTSEQNAAASRDLANTYKEAAETAKSAAETAAQNASESKTAAETAAQNAAQSKADIDSIKEGIEEAAKGENVSQIQKNMNDIGQLKESLGDKIDKVEYENIETNTESLWSIGVIAPHNIDTPSKTRLRTIPISIVGIINVEDGYEYAVVLLNSQKEPFSSGTYLAINKKTISHSASYFTDATSVNTLKEAAQDAEYMRLLLRNKTNTNSEMSTDLYSKITLENSRKGKNIEKSIKDLIGKAHVIDEGLIVNNGIYKNNELWNMWNRRLAFGMNLEKAPVPFDINGQLYVNGTIIAKNNGTNDTNRWGFHVYEAYAKDNYSRMTMLLDKHKGEIANKPSLEYYYYIGANHNADSYGLTKIGSDVRYHSFLFDRDKMYAFGEIDCRFPITLARISPSNDLDSTYETVKEADNAFEPESKSIENIKCLKYLALKNAVNGAMFYDEDRNKVVCKINGKWCDLQFSDASSNYDF